ncbi:MAG: sensor histidine kinase [Flavisolibacter sp.]
MHKQYSTWQIRLIHLALWVLAWITWFYLRYEDYATLGIAAAITTVKTLDLAILVYLANLVLIPGLLYRKKFTAFIITYILMILVSSIIKMYITGSIAEGNPGVGLKERVYNNVIPHFFLVTAGVAIKLIIDYINIQKRLAEVAKEKAESELNFLKSQINPHFLFNSLNSVYFLIDRQNTEARKALHTFSEMLRYQLYEVKGEKISIDKEISYLRDYIDLQRLRKDEHSCISLDIEEGLPGFSIEPLLLIPFVENAFKYLSQGIRKNEIHVGLSMKNGLMHFRVRNTTDGRTKPLLPECGGIGLVNVKRRLELLYPGRHQLDIQNAGGWFDVQLEIKLVN